VVARIVDALAAGEVVAAPADTVYGFLADPATERGLDRLRALKSRPAGFLTLVGSLAEAERLTRGLDAERRARLDRVWPGPVTVVLFASEHARGHEGDGVAVRIPDDPFLAAVLAAAGRPLLSTSANPRGEPTPTDAAGVLAAFGDPPPFLLVDGGPAPAALPSTLVDLRTLPGRVLRAGSGDAGPLLDPPPDAP
jgi:L-threonylcarbamoyladenylate synthase